MNQPTARRAATISMVMTLALAGLLFAPSPARAGADTDPTTLIGQGGSFLEPVISKLLNDDAASLQPLSGSYLLTDDNSGIAAFVGSAPGQFSADFTVTQRPLTAAESATAAADGRSFAYVPFAATPVAIATLVPTDEWEASASLTITASGFCQDMPLTVELLGEIFGNDQASPLSYWDDPRITCPAGGGTNGTTSAHFPIYPWANLDPSMANFALMALLDSDPTSKGYFDTALAGNSSLTTSDTPSELWPFAGSTVPGGDQPLIGKLLDLNAETNVPGTLASSWLLGGIAPLSSVWTGAPLGVPWDLPTAAVQNAQGAFVAPSTSAATAAENDATLTSTSSGTTNNLVTFNSVDTDAASYNSSLMEESYLVVPTSGLSAAKAAALAQVVRFMLGPSGQQDVESFGSAAATPAMQTAGLKVAAELNAESVAAANPATASGLAAAGTAGATSAASGTGTGSPSAGSTDGSSGSGDGSGGDLAFTGTDHLGAWIFLGVVMIGAGEFWRRRLKRREVRS
jgi:ABC-type phosphate transport system substrate-binding protein